MVFGLLTPNFTKGYVELGFLDSTRQTGRHQSNRRLTIEEKAKQIEKKEVS
jgi:hypothetical protein